MTKSEIKNLRLPKKYIRSSRTYCQIPSGGIFEFVLYALYGIDNLNFSRKFTATMFNQLFILD